MGRRVGPRGFTLAEVLVGLALVGIVLLMLMGLLQQGEQAYLVGTRRLEAQQSARVALDRLAGELRQAGIDPRGIGFPPLVNLTPTGFTIQNDLNGDGVIAGNPERITYSLTGRTLRRNAGGGAQPLIDDVESLTFTYLEAGGAAALTPGEIRSVVITITTGPGSRRAGSVAMTTQIRLRNR
ncbi:MAG: prepilin-type N-terminal cleavage/methylation domain-containing protein [Candidatus Rokubacteria bacterium]|nr:prepilin-type N-terminal cleavage/methylation domain-containing protein [Candidatus Rokubacteria bacterium]